MLWLKVEKWPTYFVCLADVPSCDNAPLLQVGALQDKQKIKRFLEVFHGNRTNWSSDGAVVSCKDIVVECVCCHSSLLNSTQSVKRLGPAVLLRLHCSVYSQARSHYWAARGLWPAPSPTWAGAPLLRRPGGPELPQEHHIDTELSADTRST